MISWTTGSPEAVCTDTAASISPAPRLVTKTVCSWRPSPALPAAQYQAELNAEPLVTSLATKSAGDGDRSVLISGR